MGKSLAEQANEEFEKACREREGHEMRNTQGFDSTDMRGGQDDNSDSRSHKPITRGSANRR